MKTSQEKELLEVPVHKLLMKYALPGVISMTVSSIYFIVDQIFIGQGVGYLGNAATNIFFPLVIISLALSMTLGEGTAAYFSLKLGQGDREEAKKAIESTLAVIVILALAFFLFVSTLFKPIIMLLGAKGQVLEYALDYGHIIIIGVPIMMISGVLGSLIRSDGSPRYAMFLLLSGAVINIILDPIFIFVFGWGVKGAAFATVIGQVFGFILGILYIPKFNNIKIRFSKIRPNLRLTLRTSAYGMSSLISFTSMTIIMIVTNKLLVSYGEISIYGADYPLAAFGNIMKVSAIVISVTLGIALGAQPIIGYNYGIKNIVRVKRACYFTLGLILIIAVIALLIFQIFPQNIINMFGQESELYNIFARKCLKIYLSTIVIIAFQISCGVYFQALGKPIQSGFITLSRQMLLFLPISIIMCHVMQNVDGLIYAGPISDILSAVIAIFMMIYSFKHDLKEDSSTLGVEDEA